MKALKEKRISLRSLWRRGLVILSLFALALASCGDSDNNSSEVVTQAPGKYVRKMDITELPAKQYLGQRVDLRGIKAHVYYSDGTDEWVTEPNRFASTPAFVTGQYDNATNAFEPMTDVMITLRAYGYPAMYELDTDVVVGIIRDTTSDGTDNDWVTNGTFQGSYSEGLNLTGVRSISPNKVYVDEENFIFKGLTLEANYTDGATLPVDLTNYYDWKIIPDYPRLNADGSCQGWLYITVGRDKEGWLDYLETYSGYTAGKYRGGITVRAALDTVYIVKEIAFKQDKALGDYFFWEPNTPDEWADRLDEVGGKLEVTYVGTDQKKTFRIFELQEMYRIWYNANLISPAGDILYDFAIRPLQYPFTAKAHPTPGLELYYRGATTDVPIDVYTRFQSIGVASKSGQDISFDAETSSGQRDNDIGISYGGDEEDLSKLITVTAVYQAYNDPNKTASAELTLIRTAGAGTYPANGATGPYYITSFDVVQADVKAKGKDATKAITVWHEVKTGEVETELESEYGQEYNYARKLVGKNITGGGTYPGLGQNFSTASQHIFAGTGTNPGTKLNKTSVSIAWKVNE